MTARHPLQPHAEPGSWKGSPTERLTDVRLKSRGSTATRPGGVADLSALGLVLGTWLVQRIAKRLGIPEHRLRGRAQGR